MNIIFALIMFMPAFTFVSGLDLLKFIKLSPSVIHGGTTEPNQLLDIPNVAFRWRLFNPSEFFRHGLISYQYTPTRDAGLIKFVYLRNIHSKSEFIERVKYLPDLPQWVWTETYRKVFDKQNLGFDVSSPSLWNYVLQDIQVGSVDGMTYYVLNLRYDKIVGYSNGTVFEAWWFGM